MVFQNVCFLRQFVIYLIMEFSIITPRFDEVTPVLPVRQGFDLIKLCDWNDDLIKLCDWNEV